MLPLCRHRYCPRQKAAVYSEFKKNALRPNADSFGLNPPPTLQTHTYYPRPVDRIIPSMIISLRWTFSFRISHEDVSFIYIYNSCNVHDIPTFAATACLPSTRTRANRPTISHGTLYDKFSSPGEHLPCEPAQKKGKRQESCTGQGFQSVQT